MSITLANRADAVLVVIDVQERLAAVMSRRERVLSAISFLCDVAAVTGVGVIATRQYPAGLGDIEPRLAASLQAVEAAGSRVAYADKVAFDCFREPAFGDALAAMGRRQLLLVGMESHICVTQTALSALARGYDVHVVVDGCCARGDDAHAVAMERLSTAGAVVTIAESVAYELVGEAGTPEFKQLLRLVKQRG